ncbi:hypothetical protein D5086_020713 [Populus alba]|uniref:Uncharacterized protein n=1 Tax=Populus alba TaxID=43335 RepID=A0ACC4BKX0_POPAL
MKKEEEFNGLTNGLTFTDIAIHLAGFRNKLLDNGFGLTSRSPTHINGVSSGVLQWKVGDNGETKQLEERKKGRISIMASDGR